MAKKKDVSIYISFLLRHKPETLGLDMDKHGWVSVKQLIDAINRDGQYQLDFDKLCDVVANDSKGRYRFDETQTKIKACQGHSIPWVEPELEYLKPPKYLYHGTTVTALKKIEESGYISKMSRHAVHTQEDIEKAWRSAERWHLTPVVLEIDAEKMYQNGFQFGRSDNNVWCVEKVPVQYICNRVYDHSKTTRKGDAMLQKLQREDYEKVYEIMETSFPESERRTYEKQVELLEEPLYQIYVLKDQGTGDIQGFMAVWDFDSIVFLEHFAVSPKYRNGGFGSVMLQELTKISKKPICLEVELPDTELAVRRIGFYERNGFCFNDYPYMQPALSETSEEIPLRIMTLEKPVEEETFSEIVKLLYKNVYHQEHIVES